MSQNRHETKVCNHRTEFPVWNSKPLLDIPNNYQPGFNSISPAKIRMMERWVREFFYIKLVLDFLNELPLKRLKIKYDLAGGLLKDNTELGNCMV